MMRTSRRGLALAAVLAMAIPAARGQGLVIDRRPDRPIAGGFDVEQVVVDAAVTEQVARVRVSQTLANPSSGTIEAEYLFPVPEAGTIRDFVLLVDGKELAGELMDADKARRVYEEIVRRKKDPALLEYMGRGLIRTSVFPIPPGAERTVTMTYTQLLKREGDVVEFSYPFGTQKFTSKPIGRLELTMRIESKTPIKSLYSPSHDVSTEQHGDHEARVRYEAHGVVPTADLRVFYTLAEGRLGATVLSYRPDRDEDGYFLLLASPDASADEDTKDAAKTVVFVLDRSGSMAGKKIDQARDALSFVLDNLRDDDTFNIIAYDDRVESFRPELQRFDSGTRKEAERFVANIRAGGSTNIDAALRTALEMLNDDDRPQYVLFLTDGLPTVGETNELKIAEHARAANRSDARVFSFGVGYDVNARLLDRLSADHGGTSEYVTPDQDIESSVARFYAKLTSPVLAGIEVAMRGTDLNRTYPRELPDLFEGGQLAWVGRYTRSGPTAVTINGKVGDERRTFTTHVDLAEPGTGSRYDFVEPLWAARRVGEIIDQIDLHGENHELTEELVRLSTTYGILTPYTSFLADETTDLAAISSNSLTTRERLGRLSEVQGLAGVGQRQAKAAYQRADRAAPAIVAESAQTVAGAVSAPVAAAPAGPGGMGMRGSGGRRYAQMMGGMGGMGGMGVMGGRNGATTYALDLEGNAVAVATVRQLGKKTFYFREGRWLDSAVTPEEEKEAKVVEQFSDDYFGLARGQSAASNQYLTFTQPVIVKLGGKVYRIEPPRAGEGE